MHTTFAGLPAGGLRDDVQAALSRAERDFTARIAAPAEWSLPGFGIAATVLAFLEPDPDVVWDDERIRAVIRDVGGPVG